MEIKRRRSDILFSTYIRQKANWRCEFCNRLCRTSDGEILFKLEASHYFSRKNESVRFDPYNVHALCFLCHQRMGGHGNKEYDTWMEEKLGTNDYNKLLLRAHTYKKRDDFLDVEYVKKLLEEEAQ